LSVYHSVQWYNAEMEYKITTRTKAYNKPGINPTTKNGTDMGWVDIGFTFTSTRIINGWIAILDNKWVMASACKTVTTPPPDEPPVDSPPVTTLTFPHEIMCRWTIGIDASGQQIMSEWRSYHD
jgi:hypothetical protein